MHGVWAEDVRDFADQAKNTQDYTAFGLFRLGFTTALTADGNAIFSTHTLIGGGTQSNTGTSALTPTSLNTGIVNLVEQKNQPESSLVLPLLFFFPPALWKHAREITDSALIADLANNNINVYRSALGITVWTSHWLGVAAVALILRGSCSLSAMALLVSFVRDSKLLLHRGSTVIILPIVIRPIIARIISALIMPDHTVVPVPSNY